MFWLWLISSKFRAGILKITCRDIFSWKYFKSMIFYFDAILVRWQFTLKVLRFNGIWVSPYSVDDISVTRYFDFTMFRFHISPSRYFGITIFRHHDISVMRYFSRTIFSTLRAFHFADVPYEYINFSIYELYEHINLTNISARAGFW